MLHNKKFLFFVALFILLLGIVATIYVSSSDKTLFKMRSFWNKPLEHKQPTTVNVDNRQKVKYSQDYTIVLLGDSMTEVLGNSDELRAYLKEYYPKKTFEVLNYGFGSTNILSVQERLEQETMHGRTFRPILDIAFDLILIESFGHNPLSQFPLEEGLKKQSEALDKIVDSIKISNPAAKIVFVATIAPNHYRYAEGQVDLAPEVREKWVNERIAYIKNHIDYAKSHNIPLVNVYERSLNKDQDGDLIYINATDFIHPSPTGVYLISKELAKTIFEQKILIN